MSINQVGYRARPFKMAILGMGSLLIFVLFVLITPKVSAGSVYPGPINGPNHQAISSHSGDWSPPKNGAGQFTNGGGYNCQHPSIYPPDATHPYQDPGACTTGLNAEQTRYKLFLPEGPLAQTSLIVVDGCWGVNDTDLFDKSPKPDKGGRKIDVSIYRTQADGGIGALQGQGQDNYNGGLPTTCVGRNLYVTVPASAFTTNQSDRYGYDVLTALVVIYKHDNSSGNKQFKLQYTAGDVFGDDDGYFALASNSADFSARSNYVFKFQPDCRYDSKTPVNISLSDIDTGDTNQTNVLGISLQEQGSTVIKDIIIFNGAYPLGVLTRGKNYILTIKNVGNDNGIRFTLPYSEYDNTDHTCPGPPTGTLSFEKCTSAYRVNGYDPDKPSQGVSFRLVHGSSETVDASGTTSAGDTQVRSTTLVKNRQYTLLLRDINNGQWYTIMRVTYPGIPANCSPDGVSITCERNTRNLQEHSNYRMTLFSYQDNYVTATPKPVSDPDGNGLYNSTATYPNMGGWLTFKSSPAQQRSPSNSSNNIISDTMTYPEPSGPDRYIYIENWHHNPNGSWSYAYKTEKVVACYTASCNLDIQGNVPGTVNGLKANTPFTVSATITNTGKAALLNSYAGKTLVLTGNGDYPINTPRPTPLAYANLPDPLLPGETHGMDFTLNTPDAIGNFLVSAYPDYFGRFKLSNNNCTVNDATVGGGCTAATCCNPTICPPVFQKFDIQPSASLSGTNWENPTTIKYTTKGTKLGSSPDVSANTQSSLTRTPYGQGETTVHSPPGGPETYGSVSHTYEYNPSVIAAGDKYCAYITINPAHGWLGPGAVVADGSPETAMSNCEKVVNEPYVHFLGNDVSAGGGLEGGTCVSKGGIKTYFNNTSTPSGSGVQIGALSIRPSYGFSSALLRSGSDPGPSTGLSFANTTNVDPVGGSNSGGTGGNMGGRHCIPDYWATKPASVTPDSSNTTNVAIGGTHYYKPTSGTLTIPAGTVPVGVNTAIFVEGNVRIATNGANRSINYQNSTNYGSPESVPSLYIIALGGRVTIDAGISQIDGVIVSQPKGGVGGEIYTCPTTAVNTVLDACREQLVVNGSFVADKVYLLRTFGSLRNASSGERLIEGGVKSCSQYNAAANTNRGDCAAEIFNFSPEIYLSQPGITPYAGPTKGTYDYITNLAPVL